MTRSSGSTRGLARVPKWIGIGTKLWLAPRRSHFLGWVLVAAFAYWLWVGLTQRSMTGDEGISILAGRSVLERGVPELPSGMFYAKGMVSSYLLAASFGLFGIDDVSILLPGLFLGLGSLVLMYLLARDLFRRPSLGVIAAVWMMLLQAQTFYAASPRMYASLQFFSTLTVYAGWHGFVLGRARFAWLSLLGLAGAILSHPQSAALFFAIPGACVAVGAWYLRNVVHGPRVGEHHAGVGTGTERSWSWGEVPGRIFRMIWPWRWILAGVLLLFALWVWIGLIGQFASHSPRIADGGGRDPRNMDVALSFGRALAQLGSLEATVPLGLVMLPLVFVLFVTGVGVRVPWRRRRRSAFPAADEPARAPAEPAPARVAPSGLADSDRTDPADRVPSSEGFRRERTRSEMAGFVYITAVFGIGTLISMLAIGHAHFRFWVMMLPLHTLLLVVTVDAFWLAARRNIEKRDVWPPISRRTAISTSASAALLLLLTSLYFGPAWYPRLVATAYGLPGRDAMDAASVSVRRMHREVRDVLEPTDRIIATNPFVADYYLGRVDGFLRERLLTAKLGMEEIPAGAADEESGNGQGSESGNGQGTATTDGVTEEAMFGSYSSETDEYYGIPLIDTIAELDALRNGGERVWIVADPKFAAYSSPRMRTRIAETFSVFRQAGSLTIYVNSPMR